MSSNLLLNIIKTSGPCFPLPSPASLFTTTTMILTLSFGTTLNDVQSRGQPVATHLLSQAFSLCLTQPHSQSPIFTPLGPQPVFTSFKTSSCTLSLDQMFLLSLLRASDHHSSVSAHSEKVYWFACFFLLVTLLHATRHRLFPVLSKCLTLSRHTKKVNFKCPSDENGLQIKWH